MLRFFSRAALTTSLAVAALLMAGSASAQTARTARQKPVKAAQVTPRATAPAPEAAAGTFQLVRLSEKVTVTITTDALSEIERRRKDTEEVSWPISNYARVRILPRSVINARGFQPLAPVANAY